MRLWKILDSNLRSCHGGEMQWHVGVWVEIQPPLEPCSNGLHFCRDQDLIHWLGDAVCPAEIDGEYVEHDDTKIVALRGRIIGGCVPTWNECTKRLFAADCAEHVLHLFERERPEHIRPRQTIEAARKFARGEIDAAARDAARAAARDAARDAAWAAVWDTASAAAWDATRAAARAAANAAARDAARAAVRAAARAAASAAAWDAARAAERKWQNDRLLQYLTGELS